MPVQDNFSNILITQQLSQLHRLQLLRLKRLLKHANKYSRYYKGKFSHVMDGMNSTDLVNIPVSTKFELMQNFDEWLTDKEITLKTVKRYISNKSNIGKPMLGKYLVMESSGSSGHPGLFLHNLKAVFIYQILEASRRANSSLLNQLLSYLYLNERLAYVGALKGHYAGTASIHYSKSCYPLLNTFIKEISIYDEYNKISKALNKYCPTIIATYPSVALNLAEQKEQIELKITPREIWLGGETLYDNEKKYIESTFNSKVFNSYGASEFPPIAWECDFGRLHINADWVILEAVDRNYQKVPNGTISHTCLITNLCNFLQPIIRYDLGDQICYDQTPCECGNILPTLKVIGRKADSFKFKNDVGNEVSITAIELISLLEECGFYNFRITQDSKLSITISLKQLKNIQEISLQITSILENYFSQKKLSAIKVNIKTIDSEYGSSGSGKFNKI